MSQTSLGAPASEKSTHVEEAILESRCASPPYRGSPQLLVCRAGPNVGWDDRAAKWGCIREVWRLWPLWDVTSSSVVCVAAGEFILQPKLGFLILQSLPCHAHPQACHQGTVLPVTQVSGPRLSWHITLLRGQPPSLQHGE